MSVVSANLVTRRSGTATADVREHEDIWEVITDNAEDTQEEILASGMIPGGFDAFPADPASRATRFRFDQDDSEPTYWLVTILYSTRQPAPGVDDGGAATGSPGDNYTDDPRTKPAQVSFRTETVQVAIQYDLDGFLISDSTGRPFDTQTIEENGVVLSITKNLAVLPISMLRLYRNAVNSDNYFGIPAGHLKMLSMRADSNFDKNVFYWSVNCEMFVADDEWIEKYGELDLLKLLDRGPEYIEGGARRRYTVDGQLSEVNLDGSGGRLADAADLIYLDFRVKPRRPFAALGIYP